MNEPLIHLIHAFLTEPVRVLGVKGDRHGVVIAGNPASGALLGLKEFINAFLPEATVQDLLTIIRAYERAVHLAIDPHQVKDLLASVRAWLVWLHRRGYTRDDLSTLISTCSPFAVVPFEKRTRGSK